MRAILHLLLLFALGTAANARIGETPAECIARYGEPLKVEKETMTIGFQKGDLLIMCVFDEGKCVEIAYQKEGDLSEVEVMTLRDVNGTQWNEILNSAIGQQSWQNETCYATQMMGEGMLIVMTKPQKKRRDEARAAKEKQKLEGF